MNSTKMAINKPSKEKEQEDEQRRKLLAMRSRGLHKAHSAGDGDGDGTDGGTRAVVGAGGEQEADAMGIRNVKTVGQKAIQLLEFRVTSFLGSIDMTRVRSMLLILADLSCSSTSDNSNKEKEDKGEEEEGPVIVQHSALLQASLHPTNSKGVISNDGIPAARRVQGLPLTSLAQNTANMEKVLELFDIDVPSSS